MSEFWKMTPYELDMAAKGYSRRRKEEEKNLIMQAYLTSRWVWTKDVPIEKILNNLELEVEKEKKVMTDEQMLAQAKALNAMFGGNVKTCNS